MFAEEPPKEQLADCSEDKLSSHRYEKLRRMSPREFAELWRCNMMGYRFDDLVDEWPNVPNGLTHMPDPQRNVVKPWKQ